MANNRAYRRVLSRWTSIVPRTVRLDLETANMDRSPSRTTSIRFLLTATLAIAAACSGGAPDAPAPRPSPAAIDSSLAVATFDTAWAIIYRTHFDTTFNGVDWLAVRNELRPRARSATTVPELRATLEEMVERLGQSHFAIIPQQAADAFNPYEEENVGDKVGYMGIRFRLIGERMVVTRVDEGSAVEAAGVEPGWIIVAVRGDSVRHLLAEARESRSRYSEEYMTWARVQGRLGGTPGDTVMMRFLDASERPRGVPIVLEADARQPVKFGNLPTFFSDVESYEVSSTERGVRVGVIWFNFWMAPLMREIDEAIDEFRGLDGIVIDLRGNAGGVALMVAGLAGHFLDEPLSLGTYKTRQVTLNIRANPRRVNTRGERVSPYEGPVAILIDEASGSASELFAGGMQAVGRARVFGTTSVGAVLPATMDRLPNDDVLYHAFAEFVTAEGMTLEGRGVIPDEPVALTRDALLAGDDPVLEAAVGWIAERRRAGGNTPDH